jgi:REP element-mobilizing transposase RayT
VNQNRGYHKLRKGRRSLENHYYFITTQTFHREPIFENRDSSLIVLNALKWLDQHRHFFLDTTVIMPDHVHFLLQLKFVPLHKIMQRFKSYTSKQIGRLFNRLGPVWQNGYYDHAVRKDEDLNQIRLYCLNNPVRAMMVDDFHKYPHWYCHLRL